MLNYQGKLGQLVMILALVALATGAALAGEGYVPGWSKSGSDYNGYIIGTEKTDRGTVAFIKSDDPKKKKFGTMSQTFSPDQYKGKRIRLSADVKCSKVENYAGMWMRVDFDGKSVAFDNMQSRPIKGSKDWHNLSIVLDVPEQSDHIAMGLLMSGEGLVYWDDLKVETVGMDVPVTDMYARPLPGRPQNLNFEDGK